jgi:membrane-bound lytic murein transglycosylase D
MSFVDKIPPMVSALAFGYGVGMAAPESAMTPVRAAVTAYQHQSAAPAVAGGSPAVLAPGSPAAPPGAAQIAARTREEPRELARLREVQARDREVRDEGAACDLDRPTQSRPPRYASTADGYAEDVEDLDAAGAEALSRLQLPDMPLAITRRTIKYVRFFARSDRGRGMFETWLKRSGRFQEMIQSELREWRLPEDLIWVAMIESGFDPRARSPAGAVGLWQFMPSTGEVYGLQQTRHLDQRKNPRLATQAAAHHLRDLYLRFGDWSLALAAYNMGYEQLLDAIDRYGTSDFNELARQGALPQETAAYVPKIAAAALIANNMERFGFDDVKLSRPLDAAEMAVPPNTPLKALAKAAGVSTATLRSLNPDLLDDRVPPGRGDYLVMVPAESLARAQTALPALLASDPLVNDAAVLNPVDLLGGRDFVRKPLQEDSLLSLLPKPRRRLPPSLRLGSRRAMRDSLESIAAGVTGGDDDDDGGDERAPRRARKRRETVMYRVGSGDTLIGVARQFAVDVEDLARDNGLEPDARLREGALLRLKVRPEMVDSAGGRDATANGVPPVPPGGRALPPPAREDEIRGAPHKSPPAGSEDERPARKTQRKKGRG